MSALLFQHLNKRSCVSGENAVLCIADSYRIRIVKIPDREDIKFIVQFLIQFYQTRQIHGQTEAGGKITGGHHMMQIGMTGSMHAAQCDSMPVKVLLQ